MSRTQFRRIWVHKYKKLRISPRGSDFCDKCVILTEKISNESGTIKEELLKELELHKRTARAEYHSYCEIRNHSKSNPSGSDIHLVMDFAEKVTLLSMERQPGQLHFVTGLRYDIFGIYCSKLDETKNFGLSEGHWPNTEDPTSILSMFITFFCH